MVIFPYRSFNPAQVIVYLLFMATLCSLSWPAATADLLQIYLDARAEDPVYASAREAWAATQEKLPQSRALLLPSATLTSNPSYTDRNIAFRNGTNAAGQFNSNSLTISVTQPLYRMQSVTQYRSAQAQLAQSDVTLAAAAQELILRVAQVYFDALLAQDSLDLARAQKSAIAEQLAVAKRNYELGATSITDIHDAQARFDLAASLEISAQNDLENRKELLQQITAKPPTALVPLGPMLALQAPEPNDVNAWVEQGSANSQQIAIQKAAVEIAEQERARVRYGHYPTLDVVANYSEAGLGQGAQGTVGSDTRSRVIGLQLAVPLYAGGSISSQERQAQFNLSKSRQDLEEATRQVGVTVKQAFRGITSGIAQIAALETALRSSQSSLNSSRLGREVGVRTQVDVLDAQQQLYTARFNLAQARYNYILNWLKLSAAVGRLAESDLRQVNGWLAATDSPAQAYAAYSVVAVSNDSRATLSRSSEDDATVTDSRAAGVSDGATIRTATGMAINASLDVARTTPARKPETSAAGATSEEARLNLALSHSLSVNPVITAISGPKGVYLQLGAFSLRNNADFYLAQLRGQ